MQKTLILIAAVLSVASIGLGWVNRNHLLNAKAVVASAQEERDATNKKLSSTAAELKSAQDRVTSLTIDRQKTSADTSDLRARLQKATEDLADLQSQSAKKDADLAQSKTDLTAKDARIALLESKSNTTNSETAPAEDLKKQLAEQSLLNASLQAKLKDNDSQISELKKAEANHKLKVMRNGLEGKILAVNPSWNFVVISLGDRNGVENNSELLINRGGQLIGKVRITTVEPSTSVADIVVNSIRPGLSVQPGDTVIFKGPESDAETKL
jgi:cell shape-determining protein MreC